MPNNIYGGREGKLLIASASSATGVSFGALAEWRLAITSRSILVAHQDSSGYNLALPGTKTGQLTARTVYLSTAATVNEQDTLRAALLAATRKYYSVSNSTAAGSQTWKFWGYVDDFDIGGSQEAPVLHNFTIQTDGKVTES